MKKKFKCKFILRKVTIVTFKEMQMVYAGAGLLTCAGSDIYGYGCAETYCGKVVSCTGESCDVVACS